ncbi:hypothetical protein HY229_03410 [Candidatus Acetothermia bacterium]|nr:hypothetical protein [Candidatus Acetothermia bacterium]MBI3643131.1 hypothetical protein [Candidatus Acetothermia bacterium]
MLNGKDRHSLDEFSFLCENSLGDLDHKSHPDRRILDRYLRVSASAQAKFDLSRERELMPWLAGASGWSDSAISAHVLSCARCRERIRSLRAVYSREIAQEIRSAWWQRIEAKLAPQFGFRGLKRPVLALLLIAFFVAMLFAVQQPNRVILSDSTDNAISTTGNGVSGTDEDDHITALRLF